MNRDDDNTRSSIVLTKGTMVSHYRIIEKIGAGCVERAKRNYDVAIRHFARAVEELLDRDTPYGFGTRFLLARSHQDNGQLGEAVDELEQLLSSYSEGRIWCIESVKLHYFLGMAYEQSGWNNKAIEQYETFLDIWKDADPGIESVEDAKERLARLKSNL
ncbi:MAG: hypothetical protein KAU35_06725 [candidate division Zixibacteria bacterium]|nr:hypothetical protein [candidate division Zixibacteria bacterium]